MVSKQYLGHQIAFGSKGEKLAPSTTTEGQTIKPSATVICMVGNKDRTSEPNEWDGESENPSATAEDQTIDPPAATDIKDKSREE